MFNDRSTGSDFKTIIVSGGAKPSFLHRNKSNLKRRHQIVTEEMVKSAFSEKLGFSPEKISPIHDGKGSCLSLIENARGECFVMKAGLFLDHHNPAEEVLWNSIIKAHAADVPVPETYVLDMSGEIIPWPYSIMERLPGTSIVNLISKKSSAVGQSIEDAGRCLCIIHGIRIPLRGYGSLVTECVRQFVETGDIPFLLRGSSETVHDRYVNSVGGTLKGLYDSSVIGKPDMNPVLSILNGEIPDSGDAVIQHGDPSMGNFLIHQNKLAGVLDGAVQIGSRLDELAQAYIHLCSLEFHFPGFSAEDAFMVLLRGYGADYETLTNDRHFMFFLITKLVCYLGILHKAERKENIRKFLALLRMTVNKLNTDIL